MSSVKTRRLAALFWVLMLWIPSFATCAQAQDKPAPAREKKTPWKPEDFVFQEYAGQFRISPDGKWAAWVKNTADKEKDKRVSNVFLSSLTENREIQLTRGTDEVSNPRWSPSGERIAFLSTRAIPKAKPEAEKKDDDEKMQIWVLDSAGGEPWNLTESNRGIKQFEWLDNDTILFSAEESPSFFESQAKERKDDSNVVDDSAHTPPVRLFKLAVKDKKVTRLTDNDDWNELFEVSRDAKKAVTVAQRELSYEWDQKIPPVTYLVDLSTGQRTQIFTDGKIRPYLIEWTRDNSGFYAAAPYSSDSRFLTATVTKVYFYDLASGTASEVNLDWDRGLGGSLQATSDGFVALMADGAHSKPLRYTRHGNTWSRKSVTGDTDRNYYQFVLGDDGHTLVYSYSTASTPMQWYHAKLDGTKITSPSQFTELNSQLKNKTIAKTEMLRWKGANDEEVEGILYYPLNYEVGKRYPLVVATHGGPAGADMDLWSESWAYASNLYAQRGAFVLKTNYHGSARYGLKWVESICCGKYYELEIPDIENGVDVLTARGLVEENKIGALGWSNGSILSIQLLVTNPDRYKAAAVGAGDVEWISDWANVDFGEAFDTYYFGKSPNQDPKLYIEKSALFKMDRVKTPTLIFFGGADRNVPTEEGWTHYRALYSIGKVPVKFILFPGEPHGPRKLSHQVRKLNEEAAWLDTYLFAGIPPPNEALKKGSPLDVALRRKLVQKSGTNFGVLFHPPSDSENPAPGVLIPEVIQRAELEIGRFEITHAQFAAFDKGYKYEPGTENFPANEITFEQASAYCKWIADLTGEPYRLAKESEVADLYKERPGENTLDYWAGYAVNPEDAQRLESLVNELTGSAPLLREVGSFVAEGGEDEDPAFDLGGNVAEWVIAADGSGKTVGGSADRPADSKARYRAADPAYTGFRVVKTRARPKPAPEPSH